MISIIINHYRTPELLKLCLKSIYAAFDPPECQIIVSDGAAMDETEEMMHADFPDAMYLLHKQNVGFARLVNSGIRAAKHEKILILNADIIIPSRKEVDALIEYMDVHPKCGMVGPKLLNMNKTIQQSAFRFYSLMTMPYRRMFLGRTPYGKKDIGRFTYADLKPEAMKYPFPADWLMGSAILVRRKAISDVGMFDESFFMYFEDVDWCRRFWEKGWEVTYDPQATLYHYHMQASRGKKGLLDIFANPYTRVHIWSAYKYFRKYGIKVPRYGK
jgi:N-acetylglucosaminyl-diphospho-decaprenol L-rhamnosyltransferase